uniref:Uncharacterized protein n=1 Tax=Romanomermis culicivorax TaxID=13658 RepID=A0A915J6M2_ROMCU
YLDLVENFLARKSAATRPIIYNNIVLLFVEFMPEIQHPPARHFLDFSQQREHRHKNDTDKIVSLNIDT